MLIFDRFHQKVVDADGTPQWQDDPHFTINAHLHRIALPAPHDQAALQDLVSTLMSTPLDLTKSPWQFHLIEEYGAGCVLLTRLHHCIADGIALMRVLLSLTDPTAEPPRPPRYRAGARRPRRPCRPDRRRQRHCARGRKAARPGDRDPA